MKGCRGGLARVRLPIAVFTLCALAAAGTKAHGVGRGLPAAGAQSASATLGGTVVDERGAVIPGASVSVANVETGLQRRVKTDGEGSFTFQLLPPNVYTIRVECYGFAMLEVRNVMLSVNDNLSYRIQLRVGGVGAYVVVEDSVTATRESASVSTLVGQRLVSNLPLNGRSFQSLFELAPGTVLTRAAFNEQGQFSVNGQRADANYFMVDGVSANTGVSAGASPGQAAGGLLPSLTALGGTNNLVSVEGLQEFRIQTSTYAPESGRTPGAQVSIVTRSGTNVFHGSVYDYVRHDALDANDWFANSRGLPKPALRQNNFGGVLGGPLVRDRAFFFFSYEGLRLRQPQVAITEVPSRGVRLAAADSVRPFLDAFPLPNGADAGNGYAQFAASYSDPSKFDAASLRLDATAGGGLTLFGRINVAPSESVQRGRGFVLGSSGQSLNTVSRTEFKTRTLTLGATQLFSSRTTHDVRVNWSGAAGRTSFSLDDFGGARPLRPAGLFPPQVPAAESRYLLVLNGGLNTSFALGKNADNRQRQMNLVDNFTVAAGRHLLKFGADYRRLSPVYGPPAYAQSAVFGEPFGVTGATLAAATGRATEVRIDSDAGARLTRFTNLSAFGQDTWSVTPRLTVTYGVRWEFNPPPSAGDDSGNPIVVDANNLIVTRGGVPGLNGSPEGTPLWRTTYGNFAPRSGVAYRLSEKFGTTLRGGFGLFYDLGTGQAAQAFGSVAPYTSTRLLRNVRLPLDGAQAAPAPPAPDSTFNTVYAFDPRLKLPYTLQWNVTVEQPLGAAQTASAAYVGSAGRRLLRESVQQRLNTPEVRVVTNSAESDYQAMQLQFGRRAAKGVQALASYTWSHSIDDASVDSSRGATVRRLDLGHDRGPSDFDVRHSLVAAVSWDLPGPVPGANGAGFIRHWSLDAIFRARTATPVHVFYGGDLLNGETVEGSARPNLDAAVPLYIYDRAAPGGRRINVAAFDTPDGQPLGRNALRGFSFSQIDLALRRRLTLTERVGLQLRIEFFNLLNHPNFADPVGDLNSDLFGQSIQTLGRGLGAGGVNGGLNPVYQVGSPRSTQLSVKLYF